MATRHFAASSLLAALVLVGCEEGGGLNLTQQSGPSATGRASEPVTVERDVEAPEVFSTEEPGLWDGRPSLGGIWVAHPDASEAQRVQITNTSNGRSTMGALFGRELLNPGPKLQVSSDAAAALGMTAGSPANLSVVAIVTRSVTVAPPPLAETAGDLSGGEIEQTTLDDPIATMAAEAIDSAAAGTTAASARSTGAVRSSLRPTARPGGSRAAAPSQPSAAQPTSTAPAAASAPLALPLVQVAIFSSEDNAEVASEQLRNAGIIPTISTFESNGKQFWRLVVGPLPSAEERTALIAKVRELGFADAFPVAK